MGFRLSTIAFRFNAFVRYMKKVENRYFKCIYKNPNLDPRSKIVSATIISSYLTKETRKHGYSLPQINHLITQIEFKGISPQV